MRIATLITWILTACIGVYMLRSLIARGGLREQRASRDGLPPAVLFGHFTLALTGLAVWIGYLASGSAWLAWLAVGLLMPAIGLGVSTVTLWTPYPGPAGPQDPGDPGDPGDPAGPPGAGPLAGRAGAGPAGYPLADRVSDEALSRALTDEQLTGQLIDDMLARLLADPPRPVRIPRVQLKALIPVGHGLAAGATFLLALLTAAGMR